jgi:hypothetical protein
MLPSVRGSGDFDAIATVDEESEVPLHLQFRVALLRAIASHSRTSSFTAKDVASMLWSFAYMNCDRSTLLMRSTNEVANYHTDFQSLFGSTLSTLVQSFAQLAPTMTPYEFAWSVWALGKMSFAYGDLPVIGQEAVMMKLSKLLHR